MTTHCYDKYIYFSEIGNSNHSNLQYLRYLLVFTHLFLLCSTVSTEQINLHNPPHEPSRLSSKWNPPAKVWIYLCLCQVLSAWSQPPLPRWLRLSGKYTRFSGYYSGSCGSGVVNSWERIECCPAAVSLAATVQTDGSC